MAQGEGDPKSQPIAPASHSLADHTMGQGWSHEHGADADHEHDDFDDDGPLEENPLWIADNVNLTSVGIDIGSSGTQVIFSRIHLRRLAEELTSRYYVVSRDTLFLSPVSLTPYASETRIDDAALRRIVEEAYAAANLKPGDIDAGAVILTGEALRRENAQAISAMLSQAGGDFVCATAGHHMESMLAAYGSGAAKASLESGARVLNVDIGGGTTKLGLCDKGQCVATAAFHVGGRLMVIDDEGRITRLDPAGKHHAARAGFQWSLGDRVTSDELDRVADAMAETAIAALVARPLPHDVEHLYLTDPILDFGTLAGVMFSGGVAEYVYARENQDFGDMGRRLGAAIRRKVEAGRLPWPLMPARECIRATAIGASEYSVQLSGNTATSPIPERCCRVAICRCCSPTSSSARVSTVKRSRKPSSRIARPSRSRTRRSTSRSPSIGRARQNMAASARSPMGSRSDSPTMSRRKSRSTSCSTATSRRRSAPCCARIAR